MNSGTAQYGSVEMVELFKSAIAERRNVWLPANGGTETPCNYRSGFRLLWCYNPAEGRHAHLDLGSDRILSNEESEMATR